ncbi:hypothetical protein D3C78_1773030 [compost metagenome]
MILQEGAITLIGFRDNIVAFSRLRVGPHIHNLATDNIGRIRTALLHDERDHRRGRCLAMRTRYSNAFAGIH